MKHTNTCLIGVDAGTTGLKSLVFDLSGQVLGKAYREYPLHCPRPDTAEQDPEDWWRALAETVREALEKSAIDPGHVAGLSISSQGSSFVAMGSDGKPLRPAMSWLDRRSATLATNGTFDEDDLFAITGLRAYPGWTASLLYWLANREPETLRRMKHMLLVGDYLIYRLSGAVATDYSSASRTRMLDLEKLAWSEPLVEALGLKMTQLPTLGASGSVAGHVSSEGAAATGLLEGTPVSLGGFDQSCAALGAGAVTPDTIMASLGTATMVFVSSSQPIVDPLRRVTTSCHVVPNTWTIQAPIMTTGAVLRWWRDHFFGNRAENVYEEMDRLAAMVPAGSEGLMVLPHFGGGGAPHWDHTWRGAIVGLGLAHTQAHVVRAILEGVAMQIRTNMDVIEGLGFDIKTLRLVGGGARSALWTGIIGDVLGKPQLRIGQVEVGTLGAAMLAGLGVGVFPTVSEAVRSMVPVGAPKAFNPGNHEVYESLRARYADTSNRLYGQQVEEYVGVAGSTVPIP